LYDPFRHTDRALARRNLVLKAMRENGFITERQFADAAASALKVTRESAESSDAPYFVDLVGDTLQSQFQNRDFQNTSYRVYTTLDMNLQHDAVTAIRKGILETDKQWTRRDKKYGTDAFPLAQVALVALNAETGEVLALSGGRSYGVSQLDHAMAKRQPGSAFKLFVYMAALRRGYTLDDTVDASPLEVGDWAPDNFGGRDYGRVTLAEAFASSINTAAVRLAQDVGLDNVIAAARDLGNYLRCQAWRSAPPR
jgi:penicillin-binding protein 1B